MRDTRQTRPGAVTAAHFNVLSTSTFATLRYGGRSDGSSQQMQRARQQWCRHRLKTAYAMPAARGAMRCRSAAQRCSKHVHRSRASCAHAAAARQMRRAARCEYAAAVCFSDALMLTRRAAAVRSARAMFAYSSGRRAAFDASARFVPTRYSYSRCLLLMRRRKTAGAERRLCPSRCCFCDADVHARYCRDVPRRTTFAAMLRVHPFLHAPARCA